MLSLATLNSGYEIFLSGSSAKLLSREIASSMRGRAWEITIHPFSFLYPADPALIPVYDRSGKPNSGHALESVVFTELQRRHAEVAYVKTAGGYEVDFLARYPDGTEQLIQVCTSVDDPETRDREVRALQAAAAEHPRAEQVILTMESRLPFPEVPEPIHVMPAWSWMLQG